MKKYKILARHNLWVAGCSITESIDLDNDALRKFVATIDGWRGFKIYEGYTWMEKRGNFEGFTSEQTIKKIIARVRKIQGRIRSGDDSVFREKTEIFSIA